MDKVNMLQNLKFRILIIHGPNLNLLGKREKSIYGGKSFDEINALLMKKIVEYQSEAEIRQSNHEGEIVTWIQEATGDFDAILINPAAYTHTSIAIRDALLAVGLPLVEVHMSNIYKREEFRLKSYISDIAEGTVTGFGVNSYLLGLEGLMGVLKGDL